MGQKCKKTLRFEYEHVEYCIHKFIKILKRNKIQCSNGNVSIVCTINLAKTHIVYFAFYSFYLTVIITLYDSY